MSTKKPFFCYLYMACNKTSDWWEFYKVITQENSKGRNLFVARVLEADGDFWGSVKVCDFTRIGCLAKRLGSSNWSQKFFLLFELLNNLYLFGLYLLNQIVDYCMEKLNEASAFVTTYAKRRLPRPSLNRTRARLLCWPFSLLMDLGRLSWKQHHQQSMVCL